MCRWWKRLSAVRECQHANFRPARAVFHASLTRRGQQIDVAAMYTPLLAFMAINPEFRSWPQRTQRNAQRDNEFGGFRTMPGFFPAAQPYSLLFVLLAFFVAIQLRNPG